MMPGWYAAAGGSPEAHYCEEWGDPPKGLCGAFVKPVASGKSRGKCKSCKRALSDRKRRRR